MSTVQRFLLHCVGCHVCFNTLNRLQQAGMRAKEQPEFTKVVACPVEFCQPGALLFAEIVNPNNHLS